MCSCSRCSRLQEKPVFSGLQVFIGLFEREAKSFQVFDPFSSVLGYGVDNIRRSSSPGRWVMRALSGLHLVASSEHVVDGSQVVSSGNDGRRVALRGVVLLEMSLLSEGAHLDRGDERPENVSSLGSKEAEDRLGGALETRRDQLLTWSYASGGTVRRPCSLACRSTFCLISLTSPTTLRLKKLLARPLP